MPDVLHLQDFDKTFYKIYKFLETGNFMLVATNDMPWYLIWKTGENPNPC